MVYVLTVLAALTGCATDVTEEAQRVVLHTHSSTLVLDCERIGNVSGEANGFLYDLARQKAVSNMRDTAARTHGADTVALANIDKIGEAFRLARFVAQGIAFRCGASG
jgi:hypothetical protein